MKARKSLRWFAKVPAVFLAYFGYTSSANSLSFEEFEKLTFNQKANFVSTALHHFYYNYRSDPNLAHKAECMMDIDGDNVRDADDRLYTFVMHDLHSAQPTGGQATSVEGVIRSIIDRTCEGR
jgi:hypothetical protein